jgi:DNA polymerase
MPQSLYWDCETRSTVDLRKTGVYIYAAHPSTSVTVARLALGDEPPCEWRPPAPQINSVVPCYRGSRCSWPGCAPDCDGRPGLPARRPLPQKYLDALADPECSVVAHNAAFERIILLLILHPRYGWPTVPIDRWVCTMARARAQALPGALDGAAQAMGLDVRKDLQGHALMLRMCRPRAVLPGGDVTWWEDEERMARLSDYCSFDVRVERALDKGLRPLSDDEVNVWRETELINDRGVRFDLDFVRAARVVGEDARVLLDEDMLRTTGGAVKKASNVTDLKRWLIRQNVDLTPPVYTTADPGIAAETQEEVDVEVLDEDVAAAGGTPDPRDDLPDLRRRDVLRLLAGDLPGAARAALIVRYEAGKISTRKLDAIEHRADAEGVVRGLFGYHGANTGRYISHGLQVQNLPRDVPPDWDECRQLLDGGRELVDALWGPPLEMISRMLRGAIIPREGYEIGASDFSSVEAVGVAWLAGETSLLEAFRRCEPIYEQMAAQVYGIPASRISKDSKERFVGKTLVLGAGYQMGWFKFRETVLAQTGIYLSDEEAYRAIAVYRETFPSIPRLWREMNRAAISAVQLPGTVTHIGHVRFRREGKWLRMRLPSGRCIWYSQPLIEPNEKYGGEKLTYMEVNAKTRKWQRGQTYGGRLTENAVQGLCRDLLVHGMLGLECAGYRPVALVHDEIICEPPGFRGTIGEQIEIMCGAPDWAKGFPLSARGNRGLRYVK